MAVFSKEFLNIDPYELKSFLIDLAETYFKTDKIDTYEAGFLGYFIQSLSHIATDTLFMNTMAYNEAFTTKAVLNSSLVNLSNMFGYDYRRVVPASGTLTIKVPLERVGFEFVIPLYTEAIADNIPYRVVNRYNVQVNTTSDIKVYKTTPSGILSSIPFSVEIEDGIPVLLFDVDIKQVDFMVYEFTFPKTELYKFYHEYIQGIENYVSNVKVFINGEEYRKVNSIFEGYAMDKIFEYNYFNGVLDITFGNGVFGYLPDDGDVAKIIIETTLGKGGNVIANMVSLKQTIHDTAGLAVRMYSFNKLPIVNGSDPESKEELRSNIIAHISSLDRLVTEKDYRNFTKIIPEFRNIIATNYLLRRDVHVNEIATFIVSFGSDNLPMPTDSISFETDTTSYEKDHIFLVNGKEFICPFRIWFDPTENIKMVHFEYISSMMNDSPYVETSLRQEVIGLNKMKWEYVGNDKIRIIAHASCSDDINPMDISIKFIFNSGTPINLLIDSSASVGNSDIVFKSVDIDISTFEEGLKDYTTELYWQSNLHSIYRSKIILRQLLDEVTWSNFLPGSHSAYKVYQVPVILKEYYDANKEFIDMNLLSSFAHYKEKFSDYNMLTDVMNIKFARTYGYSTNMRLNDYNPDAIFNYPSTFELEVPFKIEIRTYLYNTFTGTVEDIRNKIRDIVYSYYTTVTRFHMDIYRSHLARFIHDVLSDVASCEVLIPDQDIVYSFDIKDIPKTERDKILSFVPEYIWMKKDDIVVHVNILSR